LIFSNANDESGNENHGAVNGAMGIVLNEWAYLVFTYDADSKQKKLFLLWICIWKDRICWLYRSDSFQPGKLGDPYDPV